MGEVEISQVPQKTQDIFNKGLGAMERGSLDMAIDLLSQCVELEPALLQAWKFLRAAEIRRAKDKGGGGFSRTFSTTRGMPRYVRAMAAIKSGKPFQAVSLAESLLRDDPLNPKFMKLFGKAATAAGIPEAGVQTLEIGQDHFPENTEILNQLGSLYLETGRTKDARAIFEKLCEIAPNSPDAVKMLKDAMALDSLASDGWEQAADGGSYRDMIKDEEAAVRLEQDAKAVKSDKDADSLIQDTKEKIEAEPENINYYRQLSRLYMQKNMFDEALGIIGKALTMNPGDPELDNTRSQMRLQQYEFQISQLRAAGETEKADQVAVECEQFRYDDLQERVKRYPNDLRLRFELGTILYEHEYLNEAIQQFQLSQRSPKHRIRSLYFLARCFRKKNQLDMALDQLKTADSELHVMDNTKKDISYEIGLIAQQMGDRKTAAEYYKRIYQSDIGYKDIAEKIEQMYASKDEE